MADTSDSYTPNTPNTFQHPNDFVDVLMILLSPAVNVILTAAARKIMGWEKHRLTRRDRISLSELQALTGLSRMTIIAGLAILSEANILIPVGKANMAGQEYELNLGQRGPYDLAYLESIGRSSYKTSKKDQEPDVAVLGGTATVLAESEGESSHFTSAGTVTLPKLVQPLYPQNKEIKNKESMYLLSVADIQPPPDADPQESAGVDPLAALWKSALRQLKLEMPQGSFETHLPRTHLTQDPDGAYVVWSTSRGSADWLRDRMSKTIARVLRDLAPADHTPSYTQGGDTETRVRIDVTRDT